MSKNIMKNNYSFYYGKFNLKLLQKVCQKEHLSSIYNFRKII